MLYKKDIKKKSVGMQLMTRDASGELVAILQVRAKWNTEKNAPEIWPGVCQVTVHGGLEAGENFTQALFRETSEELGEEIVPVIRTLSDASELKELVNSDTPEKQIITFGAVVGENIWTTLLNKKKSSSFGGFRTIRSNEIEKIVDIEAVDKNTGVTDETIVMFPDGKEAVRLAFLKLN